MSALIDQALSLLLEDVVVVFSDDPAKADLELTCSECGEILCDVESGDSLVVLARVGLDHTSSRHS